MQPHDSAIEQLPAVLQGWCVELVQLGPRRHQPLVSCAASRAHRTLRLHAGSALVVRATVPDGISCALLCGSQKTVVRFLGQPLHASDLILAGPGASLDLFVPSGAELLILIADPGESVSQRALRSLRQQNGMATSRTVHVESIASTPRVSAVLAACRLVEKRFPEQVTLAELSRHCGVAQRTLEYGFRQLYDTTPLAYIRSQRLTRNRMALLGARARTSISQTARAFGFTHMGQYSRDYRRLFGETPSMTLARARPDSQ